MHMLMETWRNYFAENTPDLEEGDPCTMLDLLYTGYTARHPLDSQTMQEKFIELDRLLAPLPLDTQNDVFHVFCTIYSENERLAFQEGVRAGVQLALELDAE